MQQYHEQSTTSAEISRRSRKRARSSSAEQATDGRPRPVPNTTGNGTVQQALRNLLDSGINPELLNAIKHEGLSPVSSREEHNTASSNQSRLSQASNLHAHGADRSLNLMSAGDVKQLPGLHHQHAPASLATLQGSSVDSDKEHQLIGLFTQLIKAYALNTENPLTNTVIPKGWNGTLSETIQDSADTYIEATGQSNELSVAAPLKDVRTIAPEPERDVSILKEVDTLPQNESGLVGSSVVPDPVNTSSPRSDDTNFLLCEDCLRGSYVSNLHETIKTLRTQIAHLEHLNEPEPELPPRVAVLHRVICECGERTHLGVPPVRTNIFLDPPHRITAGRRWHLEGYENAFDESVFLSRNKDVVLLVYKNYQCLQDAARCQWKKSQRNDGSRAFQDPGGEFAPPYSTESMMVTSSILCQALGWATKEPQAKGATPKIAVRHEMKAPYHYFYYDRASLLRKLNRMDEEHRIQLKLLIDHVEESFEKSYSKANALFSRGLVSREAMYYLFKPDMDVVHRRGGEETAHRTKNWIIPLLEPTQPHEAKRKREAKDDTVLGTLQCCRWAFDGALWKTGSTFTIEWPNTFGDIESILSLPVYPIEYAPRAIEETLYSRGLKFWACTDRSYVSYDVPDLSGDPVQPGARYMIDTPMYKQVNPAAFPSRPPGEVIEAPTPEEMQTRSFFLLMPSEVFGHSMQTKKWVPLKVAYISPVVWNMEAFDSLVVDDDTKELVKALVTNQLAKEKGTDVLDGKGNGLVILLHGGPGTGKTLTAESVAELARKPLYRVTCGDIGTDATAVDKHLQIVLHLGRIWGCVVLLDEADVFLEERSLADMARNALVSVFLRVLEYYDGILILTSNRVGTFDEAFKSRIQLALHYDNLSRTQRRAIWANFIKRLASIEKDSVNTDSLTEHLDELAAHDMNGRQIRNSLTTARQLALYKGKKMDYGLLKHAIGVGSKFDHYLKGVKGNFSDDELAREGGVR